MGYGPVEIMVGGREVRVFSQVPGSTTELMEQIQAWVKENDMGRRIAYDTWQLNTRADVTAFLLRWQNASTL